MTLTVDLYAHWVGNDADHAAMNRFDAHIGGLMGDAASDLRVTNERRS